MSFQKFCNMSISEIEKDLNTNIKKGLKTSQIKKLQLIYGKNELRKNKLNAFYIFFRQFKSAFIYLLIGASLISFFLKEYFDAFFILIFVFINTILGFFQEYKSSKMAEILNSHLISNTRVKRNGKYFLIKSTEILPGDIIKLEAGDIIPADVRILSQNDFFVDESILTGESISVPKNQFKLKNKINEILKAENICFSGTAVKSGVCEAVVINIGKNTEVGKIAKIASELEGESLFEKDLSKISKFILFMVVGTLIFLVISNIFLNGYGNFTSILLFSIALAVSAIPESLPAVAILALSKGAHYLSKHNVIVKRISSVQDIGSVEVLCTDKTGTITENIMKVDDIYSKDRAETLKYLAMASSFNIEKKDCNNSFDIAIFNEIEEKEKIKILKAKKIKDIPFDPERKKNSKLVNINKKNILIIRGAPEEIIKSCKITEKEKNKILRLFKKHGLSGKRSMAVAIKEIFEKTYYASDEEDGFEFLGMISLFDPIKESTYSAIEKAKEKNINIKIITGDSKEVAGAVAFELKLIKDVSDVILGEDIEKMTEKELQEKCIKHNVFARCMPMHKYKIIKAIQSQKKVAFLGEGINDSPALKAAHVGIVVNDASDIARDSADIILLNKDLNVIINGITSGRQISANISKYLKATLTSNFGNFYAIVFSTFFIKFLPMLPVQLLLLNLLSDFPMMSIATDNVDDEETIHPAKFNIKEFAIFATLLGIISTFSDIILFFIFAGQGESVLQTAWFIDSVITELLLIYSIRTKKFFITAKKTSKTLSILTVVAIILAILIPVVFGDRFGFTRISGRNYLILLSITVIYFTSTEIVKLIYYKLKSKEIKKMV